MGIFFVVIGSLIFGVSALSVASDIQVGIAVGGLNLIGIGLVLIKLKPSNVETTESNS